MERKLFNSWIFIRLGGFRHGPSGAKHRGSANYPTTRLTRDTNTLMVLTWVGLEPKRHCMPYAKHEANCSFACSEAVPHSTIKSANYLIENNTKDKRLIFEYLTHLNFLCIYSIIYLFSFYYLLRFTTRVDQIGQISKLTFNKQLVKYFFPIKENMLECFSIETTQKFSWFSWD